MIVDHRLPIYSFQETIEKIASQFSKFITSESCRLHIDFAYKFYQHKMLAFTRRKLQPDEINAYARRCAFIWRLLEKNPLQTHLLDIQTTTSRTYISIATQDAPFTVDTIQLALAGISERYDFVHAILPAEFNTQGVFQGFAFHDQENASHVDRCGFISITSVMFSRALSLEEQENLKISLSKSLEMLQCVVVDYQLMEQQAGIILNQHPHVEHNGYPYHDFLKWLFNERFIFLGVRSQDKTWGILTLPHVRDLFEIKNPHNHFEMHKTIHRSSVDRRSRMVCITWVHHQIAYQIVGIFKTQFYREIPSHIPIIQQKMDMLLERFHLQKQWHDAKRIGNVLSVVPNDEILFLKEDDLFNLCFDILYSEDGVGFVYRLDQNYQNATLQVFLPRQWYGRQVMQQLCTYFERIFSGYVSATDVRLTELPFVRIVIVINRRHPQKIQLQHKTIRRDIARLSMRWEDYLDTLWDDRVDFQSVEEIFPRSYQTFFTPAQGYDDLKILVDVARTKHIKFDLKINEDTLSIRVFNPQMPLMLHNVMPTLENFGLFVQSEQSFELNTHQTPVWLHIFSCEKPKTDISQYGEKLIDILHLIHAKQTDDDFFNQLVISCALTHKQINVFRAYSKALRQFRISFSMRHCLSALTAYPEITQKLWELFCIRFDPKLNERPIELCLDEISQQLTNVLKSDHDQILRRYINIIQSTLRTNYYQIGRDYISFKFESAHIQNLPLPHPMYEIFVYAHYMEGCHLRGGKISRGGIRFSDRFEDFRNEILDLMRAQMLKNAIIVPLGSKGGFVCKNYETLKSKGVSPQILKDEAVRCYQTLIQGLLDLTDNRVGGNIQTPEHVIAYDAHDPYLVVAADKGTATFSDIANTISAQYQFWLGDAFASGGSNGYDHKKMAITARGAWISVEHHLQNLGIKKNQEFSVIGVGDMAGDIFGNGMLLSSHICLRGAFNHIHIFVDPNPDAALSFQERKRLSQMPMSSWMDYNVQLISKGGGIFERSAKTIQITPEMAHAFDISSYITDMHPDMLVQCMLKSPVDLLWFGGIGTFVKSQNETHDEVYDRSNDSVRVEAIDIRARLIGEGANLGMTQRARIEYAQKGGFVNTDFIDNSAGVSCSDHEVNIKILIDQKLDFTETERRTLLASMEEDVARLVLEDNDAQNAVLSFMEKESKEHLIYYEILMNILEQDPYSPLRRKSNMLPDSEEIERRRQKNMGLLRPELCILLSSAKNILAQHLMQHDLSAYSHILPSYFPQILCEKIDVQQHPLKNELLAMMLANQMINRTGVAYVFRIAAERDLTPSDVVLSEI